MTIRERAEAKGELTQSTFKWVAKVITLTAFVTCYVLVLSIITLCYFSPEKTVLIATNLYGEALIEFLIFWSTVPLVIYNLKDIFASFFSP